MFDYSEYIVDVDILKIENEISLSKGMDMLVYFAILEKSKRQELSDETIKALQSAVSSRMMAAIEKGEFQYRVLPDKLLIDEYLDETLYYFENAKAYYDDIISWAINGSMPVPVEYHSDFTDKQQERVALKVSQKELHERHEEPEKQLEISEASTKEAEVDASLMSTCQALKVENIDDDTLKSMGDDQYGAAKFYGALFAGIAMGRHGGSLRKEDLERMLKKMGFTNDKKIQDKDFQALWKAIPQALKIKGKPPNDIIEGVKNFV